VDRLSLGGSIGIVPVTHKGIVPGDHPDRAAGFHREAAGWRGGASSGGGGYSVIQLDLISYPGNSGSPMFDATSGGAGRLNMVFIKGGKESAVTSPQGTLRNSRPSLRRCFALSHACRTDVSPRSKTRALCLGRSGQFVHRHAGTEQVAVAIDIVDAATLGQNLLSPPRPAGRPLPAGVGAVPVAQESAWVWGRSSAGCCRPAGGLPRWRGSRRGC
jgi:hypothetical protein